MYILILYMFQLKEMEMLALTLDACVHGWGMCLNFQALCLHMIMSS